MDDRRITQDELTEWSPRTGSRPHPASRGWRDWSPRSRIEFLDRRPAGQEGANPDERLRSPDDEALPV